MLNKRKETQDSLHYMIPLVWSPKTFGFALQNEFLMIEVKIVATLEGVRTLYPNF